MFILLLLLPLLLPLLASFTETRGKPELNVHLTAPERESTAVRLPSSNVTRSRWLGGVGNRKVLVQ